MVNKHESASFGEGPDQFDLIVDTLRDHMEDPYLIDIHRDARYAQQLLADNPESDNPFVRQQIVTSLDRSWRYMNQPIEVTGQTWVKLPDEPEMTSHMCIGEKAISRGFIFFSDNTESSTDRNPKIGHCIEIPTVDGQSSMPAVITLDDLVQLQLPTPSFEARERRFAYYHPDYANWIDELAFTSVRDDQMMIDFRQFYFDGNLSNEQDLEDVRDATTYLRRRAEIDPLANYKVSLLGDVILIDDGGNGIPIHLNKSYVRTMHVEDIYLRPASITTMEAKGPQRCIPYIQTVAFEPDGRNRALLIPCTSLLWMHSLRYESAP